MTHRPAALGLARRWTAGALVAAVVGAGGLTVYLAGAESATATTTPTGTTTTGTTGSSTDSGSTSSSHDSGSGSVGSSSSGPAHTTTRGS